MERRGESERRGQGETRSRNGGQGERTRKSLLFVISPYLDIYGMTAFIITTAIVNVAQ